MTAAGFTDWWVRTYTRGLPEEIAATRRAEIENDVYEHLVDGARGAAVVSRTARGAISDLTWRRQEARTMRMQATGGRPTGFAAAWAAVTQSWFTPFAVLVGLFDVVAAIGVATEADGKMPGRAIGPVILSALGAAMFTGLWLRWSARYAGPDAPALAIRRSGRRIAVLTVVAAVGIVVLVTGTSRSPLMVGAAVLTLVLVGLAIAHDRQPHVVTASNRLRRLAIADTLMIVGVLPALALFWMIVPPLLAIIVIGGVIGTGSSVRERPAI